MRKMETDTFYANQGKRTIRFALVINQYLYRLVILCHSITKQKGAQDVKQPERGSSLIGTD